MNRLAWTLVLLVAGCASPGGPSGATSGLATSEATGAASGLATSDATGAASGLATSEATGAASGLPTSGAAAGLPTSDATGAASGLPTSGAAAGLPTSEPAGGSAGACPSGMIRVAGGELRRHKPGKRKTVDVATFCLDRTEVTVADYKACVKEKKCSPRCLEIGRCTAVPSDADWPDPKEAIRASMFCNGSRADRDGHPVNCVSFDEAKGYCAEHDKRLPTGDEWEWAAVGDKPAPIFPWGAQAPKAGELCWGRPYSRPSTCLPGSFAVDATRDGVLDMSGNLSEWVVEDLKGRPVPRLRGANWFSIDDGYVEAALWGYESLSARSEVFGFRCARSIAGL